MAKMMQVSSRVLQKSFLFLIIFWVYDYFFGKLRLFGNVLRAIRHQSIGLAIGLAIGLG